MGSVTRSLKDYPEKERKLWQNSSNEFEIEYAKEEVSAADVIALLATQDMFDLLFRLPYPTTQKGVIEKMLSEKLIVQSNGHYHITNLGALLFAKDLNTFDLGSKAPRVIKYVGKNKLFTEKDQFGKLGYAVGFERLIQYISGLLPSNEIIETVFRKTILMYPPIAIRELIVNALIHQDFREKGTYLTIEIYDNRVEISNPGHPVIEPMRFVDSYSTRNNLLANAMRRMGFCEERGTGIDKVIAQCELLQLPAPNFRTNTNQTIAVLYAHQEFSKMERQDKIRAAYQHCCLMYLTSEKMSNQSLRERFKMGESSTALVSNIIKDAINEKLIKLEYPDNKSKKYAKYIPFWA